MKKLTCHCGGVEIEVSLPNGLKNLVRCNCSFCKRHSSVMAIIDSSDLKVVKGEELLKSYQFHTKTAEHYFCSVCGCSFSSFLFNNIKFRCSICMILYASCECDS